MDLKNKKIALLGGGSWATALAKMLSDNKLEFYWYMRNNNTIEHIKKYGHNPNYISAIEFHHKTFTLTSDINTAIESASYLILAIPSVYLIGELKHLKSTIKDKIIFSAIKGIIPEYGQLVGTYLETHHNIYYKNIGVITGPCHAEEVALERLSYLTVASPIKENALFISDAISTYYIKVKITKDIIGAEYAGVLKNIYSVAAGIAHGLGYGDNFQSVLMSNAIREMKRFIKYIYKTRRDINSSAYLGDLLVTGYSIFSRNRTFGTMIGKGYTIKNAILEMNMVVEGYYATKSAFNIGIHKMNKFPIINAVYQILYDSKNPQKTFKNLTHLLD